MIVNNLLCVFFKENIINLSKTVAGAFGASKISFTYSWLELRVICQPETRGHYYVYG